jgi:hypothetical protein
MMKLSLVKARATDYRRERRRTSPFAGERTRPPMRDRNQFCSSGARASDGLELVPQIKGTWAPLMRGYCLAGHARTSPSSSD